jgi:hypothetical protein
MQDRTWTYFKHGSDSADSRYITVVMVCYVNDMLFRNRVLSTVAEELEFAAHSMCTTIDGYSQRTLEKVESVKLLAKSETWSTDKGEEWEDAREVAEVLVRVCKSQKNKGKARS